MIFKDQLCEEEKKKTFDHRLFFEVQGLPHIKPVSFMEKIACGIVNTIALSEQLQG